MATAKQPIADLYADDEAVVKDYRVDWTETTRKDWIDPVEPVVAPTDSPAP